MPVTTLFLKLAELGSDQCTQTKPAGRAHTIAGGLS